MTIDRRAMLAGLCLSAVAAPRAQAKPRIAFDAATFCAAQQAGQTVVLEVTATWCGPCQRQRPVVANLLETPALSHITLFDADYDLHKGELRRLNAHQLTTLIIYRGEAELLRSSGETQPEAVEAFLRNAI